MPFGYRSRLMRFSSFSTSYAFINRTVEISVIPSVPFFGKNHPGVTTYVHMAVKPTECVQSDLVGIWALPLSDNMVKIIISPDGSASTTANIPYPPNAGTYTVTTSSPLTIGNTPSTSCEYSVGAGAIVPVMGVLSADKMSFAFTTNYTKAIYPVGIICDVYEPEIYECNASSFSLFGIAVKIQ